MAKEVAGQDILGHPRGLAYLSFTETWERFSFYGMQALLVLYMVDQALTPGHIENIVGMAGLRSGVEGVFGPLSTQAFASQIFGLYTGFVYFTPLIGGFIGDRLLGQRRTVILGAVLMALGHLLMAFSASFLIALLLLVAGGGCLKGNISQQVGALYAPGDRRRGDAFTLFHIGINIGAFAAPIICGAVGEIFGWHYGFGLAAGGMVLALVIYLSGQRYLPPDSMHARAAAPSAKLTRTEGRTVGALTVVVILGIFFNIAYAQEFNVFVLWARDTLDRNILGWEMPVTWLLSVDGLATIIFCATLIGFWARQAQRGREPSDLGKIAIGSALGAAGMLCLAAATVLAGDGGKASVLWGVACFTLSALGFVYSWPITLALISRASPPAIGATMMGVAFASTFVANYGAGLIGGFYEKMTPLNFWLMHAAISAAGTLAIVLLYRPLNRALQADPSHQAEAWPAAGHLRPARPLARDPRPRR